MKTSTRLLIMISLIAAFLLGFTGGHIKTIMELEIETNGDGDSAIVTTLRGQQYLYAINGHTIDEWGATIYEIP